MAISFDRKCNKQRMYCSRLCNHKAAWERRREKAKAQIELLTATEQRIDALSDAEFAAQTQEIIAESSPLRQLISVEHDGSATTYVYKSTPPPSLWQRLRKCVGDVVATIKYLITTSIDEYP